MRDIREYALRHCKVLEIHEGALDEVEGNSQLQTLKEYWEKKRR